MWVGFWVISNGAEILAVENNLNLIWIEGGGFKPVIPYK